MSFSNKDSINSQNYRTKKYQKSKKIKLKDGPISVKASQMSNILGFNNKIKGNIISVSYFNSKIKNNNSKRNIDNKKNKENQNNYFSLFLENKNSNNCKKNIFKKISINNSSYYSKSLKNPLITNINNNNSKEKNEKNINILSEVLQKYSSFSGISKIKKVKNKSILNNERNDSLKNNKFNILSLPNQKPILNTENLFKHSSSTSNIKRRNKNSVIKIKQNNHSRNISLNFNYSYINTNIIDKEERNKLSYAERIKKKINNRNNNIKLILISRNNQSSDNNKIIKKIKQKNLELNMKHNKTYFFNNSNSTNELRKKIGRNNILNIDTIKIKSKYMITPKNIKKEIEVNTKPKKKIEKKYYQLYKHRKSKKQKLFSNLDKNINNNNNCIEYFSNNVIIQKHNTSININNKNTMNTKHIKNAINIIDIIKHKKPNQKIIKRKKSNLCSNYVNRINNTSINSNNYKNKKETSNVALNKNKKFNNLKEIENNQIQNKLFIENNLLNKFPDDNFDDLFSIIKKINFNCINVLKSESIFSPNNPEYECYTKKFNFMYNNFYKHYILKTKQKNKNCRKSSSKLFTESTKMKTSSQSKNKFIRNIHINPKISEFKLD